MGVRLAALATVNDMLMWFGLPAFISIEAAAVAESSSGGDSGNNDEANSNFDSLLQAEQGIIVPQTRVETSG